MIISIAIVEDTESEAALLESYLRNISNSDLHLDIAIYRSAEDFLQTWKKDKFHLLFLDIQLPQMDGLSCAKRIREIDEDVIIVFITSMAQFALNGYEVNAKDYILKPLIYDKFRRKMKRILPLVKPRNDKLISINDSVDNPELIPVDDLLFVEVFGHKLVYHCKKRDYEVYGRISDAEEKLKQFKFIRCNRNTVINPKHIKHIRGNAVEIADTVLTVSASRKSEFLNELNIWMTK